MPPAWVLERIAAEAERAEGAVEQLQAGWSLLWTMCQDARRQVGALTAALDAVTHDFAPREPRDGWPAQDICHGPGTPGNHICGRAEAAQVHRTPSVVLSGLDPETTP